jgi:hypothetical protein
MARERSRAEAASDVVHRYEELQVTFRGRLVHHLRLLRPPPQLRARQACRGSLGRTWPAPRLLQLKLYNEPVQSLETPDDNLFARIFFRFPTGFCTLTGKTLASSRTEKRCERCMTSAQREI